MKVKLCRAVTLAALIMVFLSAIAGLSINKGFASATEADYILSSFERVGQANYYSAADGCTYRVPISESAYNNFIRVEYDMIVINDAFDEVELDEKNNPTSDRKYVEGGENIVVHKENLKQYANATPLKKYYFEINAKEWCAFVFTVYYLENGEETQTYGSDVFYCRSIDNSNPTAYYNDWTYVSGKYEFNVVVTDVRQDTPRSAYSGIKKFTVLKYVSGKGTEKIDEVDNINSNNYNYVLKAGTGKAIYYIDVIDNVGNGTRVKIVEFTEISHDSGFESAVGNQIESLQKDDSFSDSVKNDLTRAYYAYYLVIQETNDELKITAAMNEVYKVMKYIAELNELKKAGEKEYVVRNINTEYFNGEILINNAGLAYEEQKYGEKAYYTVSVAQFDPLKADRKAEMNFLGIGKAEELYTISLGVVNGESEIKQAFKVPLELRLPTEFKKVTAVQTITDEEGNKTYAECAVVYGNGYTVISVPYSYGVINLFSGTSPNLRLLWLLTLIPVIAGVSVAVVFIVKKKRGQSKQIDSTENK